jgi:UDP-N-acetylmuramoyl-L-alanyl-D-glutamate--2,6-diaminopimelate ligase
VIEITSEAALQYRHLFLDLNVLVFTNLEKEHLESHGSMENYFQAKYRIGKALESSSKRPRAIIANADSEYGKRFLELDVEQKIPFSLSEVTNIQRTSNGVSFGYDDFDVQLSQPGTFSIMNALATLKVAAFLHISTSTAIDALRTLTLIPGRAERIEAGQDFLAVVDYAHTPDSLKALYEAYPQRKICVLGNTGGGRDTWKRPEMGRIADAACDEVILTNEDPYDEDPEGIVYQMANGMERKPRVIMDRREAIREALSVAKTGDAVLITGKGTDPYIMLAKGEKLKWSDAQVVREELEKLKS